MWSPTLTKPHLFPSGLGVRKEGTVPALWHYRPVWGKSTIAAVCKIMLLCKAKEGQSSAERQHRSELCPWLLNSRQFCVPVFSSIIRWQELCCLRITSKYKWEVPTTLFTLAAVTSRACGSSQSYCLRAPRGVWGQHSSHIASPKLSVRCGGGNSVNSVRQIPF